MLKRVRMITLFSVTLDRLASSVSENYLCDANVSLDCGDCFGVALFELEPAAARAGVVSPYR